MLSSPMKIESKATNSENKSDSIQKLKNMKERCSNFHKDSVERKNIGNNFNEFNTMRMSNIASIREDFTDMFTDDKTFQILTNLLQTSFILKQEESVDNDMFKYLFYASCFLIIKFEAPNLFNKIRNRACESKMDLKIIYETEKLIMNKISWKIFLVTPVEIEAVIMKELLGSNEVNDSISDQINDWINFSLCEYQIYSKFNQFTITVACLLIGLKSNQMEVEAIRLIEMVSLHQLDDMHVVNVCLSEIIRLYQTDDEEEDTINEAIENNLEGFNSIYAPMNLVIQEETTKDNSDASMDNDYSDDENSDDNQNTQMDSFNNTTGPLFDITENFDFKENLNPNIQRKIISTQKIQRRNFSSCLKKKKKKSPKRFKKVCSFNSLISGRQLKISDYVKNKKYRNLENLLTPKNTIVLN